MGICSDTDIDPTFHYDNYFNLLTVSIKGQKITMKDIYLIKSSPLKRKPEVHC